MSLAIYYIMCIFSVIWLAFRTLHVMVSLPSFCSACSTQHLSVVLSG